MERISSRLAEATAAFAPPPQDAADDAASRSQARYRRIALSATVAFLSRGLIILVNLMIVPVLINYLGKAEYGLWALLNSVGMWFAVLDLGVMNGLVNVISEAYGRNDGDRARKAVATAFALVLASSTAAAILLIALNGSIPWGRLLGSPADFAPSLLRLAVLAALLPVILALPFGLVRQIWVGYQKAYMASLMLAGTAVFTGFGVIAVLLTRPGLPLTLLATGIGPILSGVCGYLWLFGRDMPALRPALGAFDRHMARRILRLSVPLALFQIGAALVNNSQLLVIAHRADLGMAADYSIVIRLYGAVLGLVILGTQPFVPSFREAHERADHEWVRRSFRLMLSIRMIAALAIAVTFVLAGNWLLALWLRNATVSFPFPVWAILGVLLVATVWGTSHSDLLIIMDRITPQLALVLLNGAVTIILTWVLVPRFGIAGAAAALASFAVLVNAWALPRMARPIFRAAPG